MSLRLTTVALTAVVMLLAGGCVPTSSDADEGRLAVVSTMSVFSDFATAVGGEHVRVETLVEVGGDPHTYEPAPSDAALVTDADVVLDNGLGLSPWFEPLAGNVEGRLVTLTEDIAEGAVASRGVLDPHMWMVPPLVAEGYVTAIEEAFTEADPANAEDYAANARAYRRRLGRLDDELAERFATIPPDRRRLVTSHDAYRYFANHYRIEVLGTVIGVTTEEEPSAQAVSTLIDQIRRARVPTIFVESTVNPDLIERVARDAGVAVGEPLYGDSVGEPGSGADTYVGMMRANAAAIVSGLGGDA
ncbi:MAG: zinc ABC transporter substrate-binding protein [Euzebyales bacterium]|nr:zinc ABC transporter substrate-binding protein [Euzebyales bacterium]